MAANIIRNNIRVKVDSAASAHYWRDQDSGCLDSIIKKLGAKVRLPNNTSIQAQYEDRLPHVPQLSYSKEGDSVVILKNCVTCLLGPLM